MSTTILQEVAVQDLANWTRRVCMMYNKDLNALSQEVYETPIGDKTRPVFDFTAEIAGLNHRVAALLATGEMPTPTDEEQAAHRESLRNKEAGMKAIEESGEALAKAIEGTSAETWAKTHTMPWGEDMTFWQLTNLATSHVLYHDGQLNYIQCLKGDESMHWFD